MKMMVAFIWMKPPWWCRFSYFIMEAGLLQCDFPNILCRMGRSLAFSQKGLRFFRALVDTDPLFMIHWMHQVEIGGYVHEKMGMRLRLHLWPRDRRSRQRNQTRNRLWRSPGRLGLPGLRSVERKFFPAELRFIRNGHREGVFFVFMGSPCNNNLKDI